MDHAPIGRPGAGRHDRFSGGATGGRHRSGPVSVAPPSQHHVAKSSGVSSSETGVACPGPAQISPVDAATVPSETVTLSWNDVSGCTFAGYTLRVRTDADFDGDPSLNLVDTGVAGTSQEVVIPSGHQNQALYWAVKAANAPDGATWSQRTFQIVPASTGPSSAPDKPTDWRRPRSRPPRSDSPGLTTRITRTASGSTDGPFRTGVGSLSVRPLRTRRSSSTPRFSRTPTTTTTLRPKRRRRVLCLRLG